MARFSVKTMREAIQAAGGVITETARALDVSRSTVYNWLEKHPELREYVKIERDGLVDRAELNIAIAVNAGDVDVSKFVLERLGRNRGWTKQIDVGRAVELPPEVESLLRDMDISLESVAEQMLPILQQMKAEMDAEAVD